MSETTTRIERPDGTVLSLYAWMPATRPKAIVQVAHGMAEHGRRYARLGAALVEVGYGVYAHDQRGHGHSVSSPAGLGVFGPDGWNAMVADLSAVHEVVRTAHPGLPLVALGHSMGSYALQQLLLTESDRVAAAILSGSSTLDMLAAGVDGSVPLSLALFNAPFEPARTEFDWLSSDPAEVDVYVADPLCGFTVSAQSVTDMSKAGAVLADPARLAGIRPDLPVYVLAGDADPVNAELSLLHLLIERYEQAGLRNVTSRFYPGGRHEMFNETNRDDVTRELIGWIERALQSGAAS